MADDRDALEVDDEDWNEGDDEEGSPLLFLLITPFFLFAMKIADVFQRAIPPDNS